MSQPRHEHLVIVRETYLGSPVVGTLVYKQLISCSCLVVEAGLREYSNSVHNMSLANL
jgi:hypothetical protein